MSEPRFFFGMFNEEGLVRDVAQLAEGLLSIHTALEISSTV